MAAKRNKKGQFVKGSGAKKARKSGAKKPKKSGTKKASAKKPKKSGAKKGTVTARLKRLEQRQDTLTGVVATLERRVTDHDRAISQIRGVMGRRYSGAS